MGVYLNNGLGIKGKADDLISKFGAKEIPQPDSFMESWAESEILVCVVENDVFDAAALVRNAQEFRRFLPWSGDERPRRWLMLPTKAAIGIMVGGEK